MGVKNRLYEFLAYKQLKASKFEQTCGLGNGFCSKVGASITDGSLLLISKAFPELNIEWLKTGFGDMTSDKTKVEISKDNPNMLAMVKMMGEFIKLGKTNADANLLNAEANKLNAANLERLINLLESKID